MEGLAVSYSDDLERSIVGMRCCLYFDWKKLVRKHQTSMCALKVFKDEREEPVRMDLFSLHSSLRDNEMCCAFLNSWLPSRCSTRGMRLDLTFPEEQLNVVRAIASSVFTWLCMRTRLDLNNLNP